MPQQQEPLNTRTDVAIVGAGPAGLMLAMELGCRGIACVVLEEDEGPPTLPKANATSSRTMEHYRRRGIAAQIRALGLPASHPQDVVYCTRLAGPELTRFRIPSADGAAGQTCFGDYGSEAWPTPELPHRVQQMYVEPVLQAKAESYPSVRVRFGQRVVGVQEGGDDVRLQLESGAALRARYVVGCDGPRSVVRQSMGVRYSGRGSERRDFLGGLMVSLYFRAPGLYGLLGKDRAWQYWAINPAQRGLMCAIDGFERFVLIVQLQEGQTPQAVDASALLQAVVGRPFEHQLIACTPWNAGYALVADRFRSGRRFIAGDAAHLFTPTGGMGYNTSIDDAVNLGWKLAATLQGWGGETLLDSYEAERRPMAERNTAFARAMADGIGRVAVPPEVEEAGPAGDAARRALGQALAVHVAAEFNIPGLQLGLRYQGSVIAAEIGEPPPDEPNRYHPSGYPGARAPHWPVDDASLFDWFGRDFTLLALADMPTASWEAAAQRAGLPLTVLRFAEAGARQLYGADLVLVRPDHHIAWRGDGAASPDAVLARAIGRAGARPADAGFSQEMTA